MLQLSVAAIMHLLVFSWFLCVLFGSLRKQLICLPQHKQAIYAYVETMIMIILKIILCWYYILEAIAIASSKLRHCLLSTCCPHALFVRSIPFSSGQMNRRLVFANDCTFQSHCAVMDPFHNIKGPRISIDTQWGYQLLSANSTPSSWFMYTTFSTISS